MDLIRFTLLATRRGQFRRGQSFTLSADNPAAVGYQADPAWRAVRVGRAGGATEQAIRAGGKGAATYSALVELARSHAARVGALDPTERRAYLALVDAGGAGLARALAAAGLSVRGTSGPPAPAREGGRVTASTGSPVAPVSAPGEAVAGRATPPPPTTLPPVAEARGGAGAWDLGAVAEALTLPVPPATEVVAVAAPVELVDAPVAVAVVREDYPAAPTSTEVAAPDPRAALVGRLQAPDVTDAELVELAAVAGLELPDEPPTGAALVDLLYDALITT